MKPTATVDLLFTYGTLRRAAGHPAHRLLADGAKLVGTGVVRGRLYSAGEYPALVPDADGGEVTGEVYRVCSPQSTFLRLDPYEGYDRTSPETGEFARTTLPVTLDDGSVVPAWAYVYQRPLFDLQPIPHGDYARYVREDEPARRT